MQKPALHGVIFGCRLGTTAMVKTESDICSKIFSKDPLGILDGKQSGGVRSVKKGTPVRR